MLCEELRNQQDSTHNRYKNTEVPKLSFKRRPPGTTVWERAPREWAPHIHFTILDHPDGDIATAPTDSTRRHYTCDVSFTDMKSKSRVTELSLKFQRKHRRTRQGDPERTVWSSENGAKVNLWPQKVQIPGIWLSCWRNLLAVSGAILWESPGGLNQQGQRHGTLQVLCNSHFTIVFPGCQHFNYKTMFPLIYFGFALVQFYFIHHSPLL